MYCNRSTHPVCSKLCAVQKCAFIIVYMCYKSARAYIHTSMCWLYQNRYHYMGSLILRRGPQFSCDLGTGDPQISVVLGPGIPNSPEIWGRGSLILWVPIILRDMHRRRPELILRMVHRDDPVLAVECKIA